MKLAAISKTENFEVNDPNVSNVFDCFDEMIHATFEGSGFRSCESVFVPLNKQHADLIDSILLTLSVYSSDYLSDYLKDYLSEYPNNYLSD